MSETPPQPYGRALFLSYAREDAEAACRIADALRAFGVEVWFDASELRGGDQWDHKIRRQIKECAFFIPVISTKTETREEAYFRLEWKLADDRSQLMAPGKAFIVPVVIDDTPEYGSTVPDSFNKAQWTRLPDGEPSTVFIERVRALTQSHAVVARSKSDHDSAGAHPGRTTATPGSPGISWRVWGALGTVTVAAVVGIVIFLNLEPVAPPKQPAEAKPAPSATAPSATSVAIVPKIPAKSIAVLPFENRSRNPEDAYFTDGIHDNLLTQISRIRAMKTISRTSVMTYRGSDKKLGAIAGELGVATILEGGVQRAGNQVRINVQLIDAATDTHLWAETYTRAMTAENIFAIQSEIAGAIATALKSVLLPEEQEQITKLPTQNMAALEALFRAKESRERGTVGGNEKAIADLEKAVALDPDFVLAQAMTGETLLDQIWLAGLPQGEQISEAEHHILRAVSLDERSSEAFAALGYLRRLQGRGDEAESAYQRAIELSPNNAGAYRGYILYLEYTVGDAAAIARVLQRYLELDPNSETGQSLQAARLIATGRLQEALQLRESIAARHPENAQIQYSLGILYSDYFGRHDDAVIALRKAHALDPRSPPIASKLAIEHSNLGDAAGTFFWRDRYFSILPGSYRDEGWSALLSNVLGDKATAEKLALQAVETDPRDGFALWILLNADISSGHPEKSRERYVKAVPALFKPDAKIDATNFWHAKDVARVLYATGEREQADYLISEVLRVTRSMPSKLGALVLEMIAHAVAGHDAEALQAARRFLDAGGSPGELVEREEEFASLQKYPEFRDMIERERNRIPAQLARINRMEAAGELAPIPHLPVAVN